MRSFLALSALLSAATPVGCSSSQTEGDGSAAVREGVPTTEGTANAMAQSTEGAPSSGAVQEADESVLIPGGGQPTTPKASKATFSLGSVDNVSVTDGLHHQVTETTDGSAEVVLRFDATSGDDGMLFEFAYDGAPAEFALVDRGFMTVVQDGEDFLATEGQVQITVLSDQRMRVDLTDVVVGRPIPASGAFEEVHAIGDGFVEGQVARSCQYLSKVFDDTTVHNSDGTPNEMLREDATWTSEFCAPYATMAQ